MPMILLNIAITLLFIQGIVATSSGGSGGTTIGYQPTHNDEQWVAEEEFHGASSHQHQPKQHKKKKKKIKESSSYPGHEHINEQSWWDEDDTDERLSMQEQSAQPSIATTKEEKEKTHRKKHRIRIWKNKSTTTKSSVGDGTKSQTDKKSNEDTNTSTESKSSISSSEYDEEHPMRTDEWQLNIQLSRLYSNKYDMNELFPECYSITDRSTPPKDQNVPDVSKRKSSSGYYRKRQVMQFARNGYVKILVDDNNTDSKDNNLRTKKPRVGKWRIGHSGVAFDIPVQISPRRKTKGSSSEQQPRLTTLHYHADIHLNKFGERPRMFRGVITRDRYASSFLPPNFLRPVVGTFSAEGIGHDTSDTSYRERAISLSRQQVNNEAKGDM